MWKAKKQPPDAWGAANRVYGPGTGVPGKRDPMLTPYNIMFGRAFSEGYMGKRYKRVVLVEGAQGGKALALDTPIPTPQGWTTMGDVRVGDVLFDERGAQCVVTAMSQVQHNRDCYRVDLEDGTSIIASDDHRWLVRQTNGKRVTESVMTTAAMVAVGVAYRDNRARFSIKVAGALEAAPAALPIAPYVLGAWLGDGHACSGTIFSGQDDSAEMASLLRGEGHEVNLLPRRTCIALRLDPQNTVSAEGDLLVRVQTFAKQLRDAGVFKNKHIPSAYLRASYAQRLALLQGLLDTDGHCEAKRGGVTIGQKSQTLAFQILELVRSLGFKPTMRVKDAMLNGRFISKSYVVSFKAYSDTPVFRLARKVEMLQPRNASPAQPDVTFRRTITAIAPIASVPVKCIAVSSPSHLFLAGDGMVPTHNTDTMLDIIGERLDNRPAPMLYVGPSKDFVTDQFEPRLVEMFGQSTSLASKVLGGLDSKKQKKTLKRIAGTRLRLAHAGSSTALKSDPAAVALVDEYDEMLKNVKGQGDPLGLVEARGFTYADFVVGITSTPSTGMVQVETDPVSGLEFWKPGEAEEVQSPIWRLWQEGTRHHFCWPCPHCDEYFVPRSNLLHYAPGCTAAEAHRTATVTCPHCGGEITDAHKPDMNARGLPVGPGQRIVNGEVVGEPLDTSTLSIWVSGLCSPFRTFGDRAAALVAALKTTENAKIQTATNAEFGECFIERGGELPTWEELKARAMPYSMDTVPDAARFLTCGIDVQKDRTPFVIRAWGPKATSWLVRHGEVFGDTSQTEVWDDLEELLRTSIGNSERLVKLAFLDSGFRPGKKFQVPVNRVYEFCRKNRNFVFPTKGSSKPLVRPLAQSKLEVNKYGGAEKYGLDLMRLDTDHWKSFVHERLGWASTKPGAWHTSAEAEDAYFKQVVAETRVIVEGKPKWLELARENHYLDCEAMAAAVAYLLNAQYIRGGKEENESDASNSEEEAVEVASIEGEAPAAVATAPRPNKHAKLAALAAQMSSR